MSTARTLIHDPVARKAWRAAAMQRAAMQRAAERRAAREAAPTQRKTGRAAALEAKRAAGRERVVARAVAREQRREARRSLVHQSPRYRNFMALYDHFYQAGQVTTLTTEEHHAIRCKYSQDITNMARPTCDYVIARAILTVAITDLCPANLDARLAAVAAWTPVV